MSKYVGKDIDRGIYKIIFAPVLSEFDHKDQALDAARHSGWGDDQEFDDYEVVKVESTVPVDQYPYVCGGCGDFVHTDQFGACAGCGVTDWNERLE